MQTAKLSPRLGGSLNFKGTLAKVRISANDNTDRLSVLEHKMPCGEAPPLHVHKNEDEIFILLSGRIRFEVDGKTITAEAGDVVMAPKGVPHRFIVESKDGAHCFTIMRGSDFETMVREVSHAIDFEEVPAFAEPTPAMMHELMAAIARNNMEVLGPPLAA